MKIKTSQIKKNMNHHKPLIPNNKKFEQALKTYYYLFLGVLFAMGFWPLSIIGFFAQNYLLKQFKKGLMRKLADVNAKHNSGENSQEIKYFKQIERIINALNKPNTDHADISVPKETIIINHNPDEYKIIQSNKPSNDSNMLRSVLSVVGFVSFILIAIIYFSLN